MLQLGASQRPSSRKRWYPKRVHGDQGDSFRPLRRFLQRKGIHNTIPARSNQAHSAVFYQALYCQCNLMERLINLLKQWRRVATRYDKRAASYAAMATLAMIFVWI